MRNIYGVSPNAMCSFMFSCLFDNQNNFVLYKCSFIDFLLVCLFAKPHQQGSYSRLLVSGAGLIEFTLAVLGILSLSSLYCFTFV